MATEEILTPSSLGNLRIVKAGDLDGPERVLVFGKPGDGKGHPYGTSILTPNGWRYIEHLVPGDIVSNSLGGISTVTQVHDRGELPVFTVRMNDGSQVTVDGDHLWTAKRHSSKVWEDVGTRNLDVGQRWSIPMCVPIYMEHTDTPIHPYVMGVLLGGGGFTDGSISLATDYLTALRVESLLPNGVKLSPRVKRNNYRLVHLPGMPNPLLKEITRCGLRGRHSYDKFIPEEYLFNSIDSRIALLRGIMDTDGELQARTPDSVSVRFPSYSKELVNGVAFLVESLGGSVRHTKGNYYYMYKGERRKGRVSYRLSINIRINPFLTRSGWAPNAKFRPNRVIQSVEPCGTAEVRCISVDSPNQLYVTEHCIVTHNTPFLGSANRVAAFSPCLFVNVDREDGPKSLKWVYPEVNIVHIATFQGLYDLLEALWNKRMAGYKSLILDGGTTAQLRGLEHYHGTGKGSIRQFTDPVTPTRQNHGWDKSKGQMSALFDVLCDFPIHIFVTAWARNVATEPSGKGSMNEERGELWQPDFTPAVYSAACGRFSSLLFFRRGRISGQRLLKSRNTADSIGRDRGNRLPPVLKNPIMADLAKHWNLDCSPVNGGAERYVEPKDEDD